MMRRGINNGFTAIAAMTVWLEDGPSTHRPKTTAFLDELDDTETRQLAHGLIGLCGELLLARAIETSTPMQHQLQRVASSLADMATFLKPDQEGT